MRDSREKPVLRIGRIPYANLLPIFHALEARFSLDGVRFVTGAPSELNRKLRAGLLDLSPSSSIEYGKFPDRYLLVPGLSVASRSKVMSVVLLSNGPLRSLPADPVAVTAASDTSVVLLEILLREFLGKRNRLVRTTLSPVEALQKYPAYLAIGDAAIRATLEGTASHATDLGAWWRKETGLPFVFALWIVSRAALGAKGEVLRRFGGMLLAAKKAARDLVRGNAHEAIGPAWIPAAWRAEYWRNLSYDLDEEAEGLRHFFRLAHRIGKIPAVPPLRFLEIGPAPVP